MDLGFGHLVLHGIMDILGTQDEVNGLFSKEARLLGILEHKFLTGGLFSSSNIIN